MQHELELELEPTFQVGDRVQLRDGRQGVVCNPTDHGKHPMATHSLVLVEGKSKPQWVQNGLLKLEPENGCL